MIEEFQMFLSSMSAKFKFRTLPLVLQKNHKEKEDSKSTPSGGKWAVWIRVNYLEVVKVWGFIIQQGRVTMWFEIEALPLWPLPRWLTTAQWLQSGGSQMPVHLSR
jgi:hypothetical protein